MNENTKKKIEEEIITLKKNINNCEDVSRQNILTLYVSGYNDSAIQVMKNEVELLESILAGI